MTVRQSHTFRQASYTRLIERTKATISAMINAATRSIHATPQPDMPLRREQDGVWRVSFAGYGSMPKP